MENVRRVKKSGMLSKLAKKIREECEREWEAENQPGTSGRQDTQTGPDPSVPVDDSVEEIFLDDDIGVPEDDEYEEEWLEQSFMESDEEWHTALNDLLAIVRESTDYFVPKDSRTFLKTPIDVGKALTTASGGQLWYEGIEKSLQYHFRSRIPAVNEISINLFVDGLPLHQSGPTQLWPIMIQLHELPEVPILVIGTYCGMGKPNNVEEYLRPLATDLNHVLENGVHINHTKIYVRIRAFIADSPARAFIKGVANYNAANGCIKCKIVGRRRNARMTFEGTAEARTDAEFRSGQYVIGHQKRPTPLLDVIGFDMVKTITVADDLHILHLGVTKRLLEGYVEGNLTPVSKWTVGEQREISNILVSTQLPVEIHRVMRSLKHLKYWKGSELRTFLNLIIIPLLKGRIHDDEYRHFKKLYVAVTLLSSKHFEQHWNFAAALLEKFVLDFGLHYDRSYINSNVHNLLHIAADVREFGPLHTLSSYPFEGKLQFIKGLVRTGHRTLAQVVSRLTELRELEASVNIDNNIQYPIVKNKKNEAILHIKSRFTLRKGDRNGWFLTKNDKLVRYSNVREVSGSYVIEGQQLLEAKTAFSGPINSEVIFNYEGSVANISDDTVQDMEMEIEELVPTIEQGAATLMLLLLEEEEEEEEEQSREEDTGSCCTTDLFLEREDVWSQLFQTIDGEGPNNRYNGFLRLNREELCISDRAGSL
ncbi:uncharacterized protein LOC128718306 [Anopheles marshallii]|uniref:uncharacterized protein LOC128718306 n=1 Tax=Anopheles marshallii TaxID=1521116 RepID=UPI00237A7C27|nr:uncharacterized protein LOC128718306 [Anopheles marshallii]